MGNPNLKAIFHSPVVNTAVVMATVENQKLANIRKVMPMATAEPAGTVLEIAVEVWVSIKPCQKPRCGSTAW